MAANAKEQPAEFPPDATVCSVLEDAHGRIKSLAERLRELATDRTERKGETLRLVTHLDLWVRDMPGYGRNGRPAQRAMLGAEVGGNLHRLLGMSGMHDAAHLPPATFPSGVEGFRGADYETEHGAAYRLTRTARKDPIEAWLGATGIGMEDDLFTTVEAQPREMVARLSGEDRQHLYVVQRGILDNVEALDFVLDGTCSTPEALEMLGRPL